MVYPCEKLPASEELIFGQLGLQELISWSEVLLSLIDAPRSGAPKKIKPEQLELLKKEANDEPLTATSLLAKHIEASGEAVHVNTIKGGMKKVGYIWKRTRSSLKKRNEDEFRAMQLEVARYSESKRQEEKAF